MCIPEAPTFVAVLYIGSIQSIHDTEVLYWPYLAGYIPNNFLKSAEPEAASLINGPKFRE
jgi:hypothetical protein